MRWLVPAAIVVLAVVLVRRQGQGADASSDPWPELWGETGLDLPAAPPTWLDAETDTASSGWTGWLSDAAQSVSDTMTQASNAVRSAVSRIVETGAGFNVLQLADGTVVRQQGARNWRNNNPGNIEYGAFAIAHGAIGTDGRFAIFPTYEAGRAAKEALIFEGANYRNLTLTQAIARYAPPTENDTEGYQRAVLAAVGGSNLPMYAYSAPQRAAILDAMERQEGFRVGSVTTINQGTA